MRSRTRWRARAFQAEYRTLHRGRLGALALGVRRNLDERGLRHGRLIGTVTEITERKRLEDSHRDKSESLNIAQTAAGIATMDLNFHRRSWICSDNLHAMLGTPRHHPVERLERPAARVHPDDVERVRRAPVRDRPRRALLPL